MRKPAISMLSAVVLVAGVTACEVPQETRSSEPTLGHPYKTKVDPSGGTPIPLVVTVSSPRAFKPTDPTDAGKGDDVYFIVTIKNISKTETFTADVVPSDAVSGLEADDPGLDEAGGHGKSGHPICDLDQNICGIDGSPHIKPGESFTFKDGYEVQQLDGIAYKVQPAGLAGDTLYFQK